MPRKRRKAEAPVTREDIEDMLRLHGLDEDAMVRDYLPEREN